VQGRRIGVAGGVRRHTVEAVAGMVQQGLQVAERAWLQSQADVLKRQSNNATAANRHRAHRIAGNRHGAAVIWFLRRAGGRLLTVLMTHCTPSTNGQARSATASRDKGNGWLSLARQADFSIDPDRSVMQIILN
jgi:hypothetical protein